MAELLEGLTIRFPARPGYLAISRLNGTAMAAGAGFDVEGLDDLRLAIDEAVSWLVGGADAADEAGAAVELTIACRRGELQFRGQRSGGPAETSAADLGDLAQAILGATVDEVDVGIGEDGHRYIDLVKRTNGSDG